MLYLQYFWHLAQILVIWSTGLMVSLIVGPFFLLISKEQLCAVKFPCIRSFRKTISCKMDENLLFLFFKILFYAKRAKLILSILAIIFNVWTMLGMNAFNIHIAYVIYSFVLLFCSLFAMWTPKIISFPAQFNPILAFSCV